MSLYLGGNKVKLALNGMFWKIKPIVKIIRLLSLDDFILQDSEGYFLVPKVGE